MTLYDIFKNINDLKKKDLIVEAFKQNSSKALKEILSYTYDENIEWLLPEGEPPYTPSKDNPIDLIQSLPQQMRRLPIMLNVGEYPNLKPSKREMIFLEILQTIHPDDAKLLIGVKMRKLPFNNLSRELAEKAFPLLAEKWKKRNY